MRPPLACPAALVILLTPLIWLTPLIGLSGAFAVDSERPDRAQTEVGRLIEQLGSNSYATRVRAKEKLQRMGLEAFDELHLAQFHADNEIAMEARFLISSLLVSWSKESDPPQVRDALMEYGAQDESERSNRIEILAELPGRTGLAALVRLTRFETSLRLSRRAALALMQQSMHADPKLRRRNAKQVIEVLGSNDRQASEWLRVYAEDLASGDYSTARWRELIGAQRDQIDSASTQQASRPSVLELVRACAKRAADAGQVGEALKLASANIDLIEPTSRHLIDACSWAIDNELHPFVLELRRQHKRMFDQQPILLYGAAEAKKLAGDDREADRLAQQASEIKPLPRNEAERARMQPKLIEDTANAHRELGWKLKERGLFHWAEREFRQIIDSMDVDSRPAAFARSDLAQMLGEMEQHEEVIKVLKPLTERMENDGKLRQQLNTMLFPYNRIRSDVDYHSALLLIEQGKVDEARPVLAKSFRMYPPNIDILIAMYRLDGDATWKTTVAKTLQSTTRQLEAEVQNAQTQMRQLGPGGDIMLSQELNQYAWLISNTNGDYAKALSFSLQSLELGVDGAKLDTCARCYFAMGDIDNAVRMQKRALKLMPHSPPLKRQLSEFEAARAKMTSASNQPDSEESGDAPNQ
jgi:tetratricopeptide (TPR) repeat protein